jgi:hypothetical protein
MLAAALTALAMLGGRADDDGGTTVGVSDCDTIT